MKMFAIAVFMFFVVYTFLTTVSNQSLVNSYCRRTVQEETSRVYEAGLLLRDRDSEEENYATCLEKMNGTTILELLMATLSPKDKAKTIFQ